MEKTGGGNMKSHVSAKTMLGYGIGNFGITLIWSTISSFLSVYLTDTVGISVGIVGTMMMISRLFDGFSDVGMGIVVDKTRSRWGKARPWMLLMSVPLAITFVLLFSIPAGMTQKKTLVYVFIIYNLVTTIFYTACTIPYATLLSLMTRDQQSKSVTNIVRTALGGFGTVFISLATMPIVEHFLDERKGWTAMAAFYGILLIGLVFVTFLTVKEKIGSGVVKTKKQKLPFKKAVSILFKNKYWLVISILCIILSIMNLPGLNMYYCKYVLQNTKYFGLMNMSNLLPVIPLMFAMPWFFKKFGKRNTSIAGFVVYLVGCILAFFAPSSPTVVLSACMIRGAGLGPALLSQFALIADTVEYGEWKTGIRTEGLINSTCTFGNKVGTGIGTALVSWILAFGGYDGMKAVQSDSAVWSIKFVFLVIPVIIAVICIVLLYFYKLDKMYPQVVSELEERDQDYDEEN